LKRNLQSLEIRVLIDELKEKLANAYFEKIYKTRDGYVLALSRHGKKLIKILPGVAFFEIPELVEETTQTSFTQRIRKLLERQKLVDLQTYKSERILIMVFENYKLILEFFNPGVIVSTDKDYNIIVSNLVKNFGWRTIKPGEKYLFRESLDPFDYNDFIKIKQSNKKDLVRALAIDLGLGRVYSNELLLRTDIENKKPSELSDEELNLLYKTFRELISQKKPNIVDNYEDAVPFDLLYYKDKQKTYFSTYNETLREYYSKVKIESEENLVLKRKLESIERNIEEIKQKMEEYKTKADLIMTNLAFLEDLRNKILESAKLYGWEKTKQYLAKKGIEINEKENYFIIDL